MTVRPAVGRPTTSLPYMLKQQENNVFCNSNLLQSSTRNRSSGLNGWQRRRGFDLGTILFVTALMFPVVTIIVSAMRVDPERIAARLRIEQEIRYDKIAASRHRRQLGGTPKEETIHVTAPLFSGRLFDYGSEAGDRELTAGLDVAKKLPLARPLYYYGKNYSFVYVLSNGGIGFEGSAHSYRANVLPGNIRLIAPFWNRNELRNGGHVYFREVTNGRVLERGQSEIRYQYDHEVKVQSAIVITWDKMQPLGTAPLPDENTNTFQMAIFIADSGRAYANFIYSNIGWTQGAEAGFSNGDNSNHFSLPTSGTGNIMYLEDYGNTGIPGEWMFILGDDRLIRCKAGIKGDTCDENCAAGEWGADCSGCCHCASNASCDKISGECLTKGGKSSGSNSNNGGGCMECWSGPNCQIKDEKCARENATQKNCAPNAILFTDYDRCGEPMQRCECLAGFEQYGNQECRDVDECGQPGTCHESAICTNTPGRFFCQCAAGFNGDGVSECVASFLYPNDKAQKLSHTKNGKVAWKLRTPLKLFGALRERIVISLKGLIIVKEKAKIRENDQLDDMDILGFAPFFAPIDYSKDGEVSVSETTDADVLTRVTKNVNENLAPGERPFRAASVVIISFMNVSTPGAQSANNFQTLLVGGINEEGENASFVQFLYKDLAWSDGAEAGIMTADKSNSIHLPGSGTAGIEQLSQLSNIRSPGIWMYRIDGETVLPCMTSDLQPPYCDAQSPTLVSNSRRPPVTTTFTTTPHAEGAIDEKVSVEEANIIREPAESQNRHSHPVLTQQRPQQLTDQVGPVRPFPPQQFPPPLEDNISPSSTITQSPHRSHSRTPAFSSKEISDIPSDVFDFPNAITVVPQLITAEKPFTSTPNPVVPNEILIDKSDQSRIALPGVSIIQPEIIHASNAETSQRTSTVLLVTTVPAQMSQNVIVQEEKKTEKPTIEFSNDKNGENIENSSVQQSKNEVEKNHSENEAENERVIEIEPKESVIIPELSQSSTPLQETASQESKTEPANRNVVSESTANQLFVFSSTTKKPNTPKKTKYVIQKQKPTTENPTDIDAANAAPYDPDRVLDAEAPANKFALVITVSVIAGWLLVLVGVGAYVTCKRRRNQDMLRAMYGPAYQIRPIGVGFTTRDGEKHQHHYETSYEDHLEKAARLNSEVSAYNPGGRISLYGSYWNLSNASHGSGSHKDDCDAISINGTDSPNIIISPTNTTEEVDASAANTVVSNSPLHSTLAVKMGNCNATSRRRVEDTLACDFLTKNDAPMVGRDDFSPLNTTGRYRPNYNSAFRENNKAYHYLANHHRNGVNRISHFHQPPHHIILSSSPMESYLPFTRFPPNVMRH